MTASPHSSHSLAEETDRAAVIETVHRYGYALDERNFSRPDEVFAPDAVVRYGGAHAAAGRWGGCVGK